jgi:hypothetical protein
LEKSAAASASSATTPSPSVRANPSFSTPPSPLSLGGGGIRPSPVTKGTPSPSSYSHSPSSSPSPFSLGGGVFPGKRDRGCKFDSACMDFSCPFSHATRRQVCLRLEACKHSTCPWLHPPLRSSFQMLLDGLLMFDLDKSGGPVTKAARRVKKARDQALANFADASDRRMEAVDKIDADIEKAKCSEIVEQIESFDLFVAPLLNDLAKLHEGGAEPDKSRVFNLLRRIDREIYRLDCSPKPALTRRVEIMNLLGRADVDSLVVRGATGSGKSTQLPQYIAEFVIERNEEARKSKKEGKGKGGGARPMKVICTQPRKVAAVSLAERVNEEWAAILPSAEGEASKWPARGMPKIGGTVGYRTGNGGRKTTKWTVIEYVTEAVLLQDIMRRGAAALRDVSVVILDEAHERSVTLDLLVGRLKLIREETGRRGDLKIIVTSATLDVELFSKYFGGCPNVEIPGRMFPVEDIYRPPPESMGKLSIVANVVDCVVDIHRSSSLEDGDILAFLPGQKEVDEAVSFIERELAKCKDGSDPLVLLLPLYGQQEPDEQRPVFLPPPPGHRKIVISTNVAETSVT